MKTSTDSWAPKTGAQSLSHPEARTAPSRTGVLGTILTELAFGEDEREALAELATWLSDDLDELVHIAATRARSVALESEGVQVAVDPLGTRAPVRPSIRNLRRHAARQWLVATLEGNYDSAFSRQVRHTWMPILLAEAHHNRATPAFVGAFLSYFEGIVASRVVDTTADNIVPYWRMLHAFRLAISVQRRIFGLAPEAG